MNAVVRGLSPRPSDAVLEVRFEDIRDDLARAIALVSVCEAALPQDTALGEPEVRRTLGICEEMLQAVYSSLDDAWRRPATEDELQACERP